MSGPSLLSVVIINYNGRRYLDELFSSLQGQSIQNFEILFVDNASSDGSPSYVERQFPWARVIRHQSNQGFAVAANSAAQLAQGQHLVLVNTDVKLDPFFLENLLQTVEADRSIAAVAAKLRLYDRPKTLNGIGGMMNYLGYTWDRGMFEEDLGQYDESSEVLFASGAASLYRKSCFLNCGGFDEKFFMYHEDVDLCWRLWLFGFRVVTAPAAVAYHHFGGSTRAHQGLMWRELLGERHNIRSLLKNYQVRNGWRAIRDLLLLPQSPKRKLAQLRNLLWNLGKLTDTLRQRQWIQSQRTRTDNELRRLIVQSSDVPVRL
ncbi:MAG: glycosyltransferase family 2 protein [Acidobacteria bacterium]|nr:glycosyltransferase family 2 protein [Acidobacteriota bacterium]